LNLTLLLVCAYILGSIPFGALISRARGIDIFKVGSGNIGATNVIRAAGWKVGLIVFLLDVSKGLGPTLVGRFLFPHQEWIWVIAGETAAIGHCFSPFLKFRGGKGIACLLGMLFGATPAIAGIVLVTFAIVVALTRYVSLGSILAVVSACIAAAGLHQPKRVIALYCAALLLSIILHRKNIKRLIGGTELKVGKKSRPADPG
jgi:glycerol-3-phosphate acyltransferase PlsY